MKVMLMVMTSCASLEFLYNLETEMDKFAKEPPEGAARVEDLPGTVFPGKALVDLLQRAGFTLGNAQAVGLLIDRIGAYDMEKSMLSEALIWLNLALF